MSDSCNSRIPSLKMEIFQDYQGSKLKIKAGRRESVRKSVRESVRENQPESRKTVFTKHSVKQPDDTWHLILSIIWLTLKNGRQKVSTAETHFSLPFRSANISCLIWVLWTVEPARRSTNTAVQAVFRHTVCVTYFKRSFDWRLRADAKV